MFCVHRLGDRLVHVLRIGGAEDARRPRGVGHQRRAFGHLVADLPQLLDVRLIDLAEVEPDAGVARHDVRLIAAVGDHRSASAATGAGARGGTASPTLISSTASSAERPRHGAPAAVRGLALEGVLDRHQAGAAAVAPRHAEVVADVREQADVDVLEHAVAHEPRLGADQLLGDAGPQHRACPAACRAP